MVKNSVLLTDKEFAGNPQDGGELLIQITEDSFSYAILDFETKIPKVLFYLQDEQSIKVKLIEIFKNDEFLSLNFKAVKATVLTSNFTFIPSEFYDEQQIEKFSKFLNAKNNLQHHHHKNLEIHTLFEIEDEFLKVLPQNTVYFPPLSSLIASTNEGAGDCLLLEFYATSVSFLYLKNGQLQFQKNFSIATLEEFTYYLLLVNNQLEMSLDTKILVQGLVDEDDDYFGCLKAYFSNVRLNQVDCIFPNDFANEWPAHYFNNLLALQLCE